MKKLKTLLLAAIVLLITACSKSDEKTIVPPVDPPKPEIPSLPGDVDALRYVFDIDAVPQITLEVTAAEWNKLLSNFDINEQNEEYIMANFAFVKNGKTEAIDSIGIRIRGNTSRRRPEGNKGEVHSSTNPNWHHAHFALNFKKYVKSKRFNTLQKVNLKWFKDDATYTREVYCYDLFERYGIWTAPKSSYARLTIQVKGDAKPAYFGVYNLIESIDEDYLANRKDGFGDDAGFLWKSSYGADLKYADEGKMGVEDVKLDASQSKYFVYDLKTNDKQLSSAKSQLVQFITDFNSKSGADFESWLNATIDVDLFLKTYAVNVMVGMWDDYWANSNNYYFYFNGKGKFFFIPYDYDNTLGTSLIMNNAGTQDPTNWGKDNNPVVKKIISIPANRAKYIAYLKELADPSKELFATDKSIARLTKWQGLIQSYIWNDTGEDMLIEDKPASWGNCGFYRLLSGDENSNFFNAKIRSIPSN